MIGKLSGVLQRGLALMLAVLLFACSENTPPPTIDRVAERLPLPMPRIEPLATLDGVNLTPGMESTLALRRAFFARDYATLDAAMAQAHTESLARADAEDPVVEESAWRLEDNLESTVLAGVDTCDGWITAMPRSYPAHWLCGSMWLHAAWKARGTAYANEVGAERFALMHERLARAQALLERATSLTPQPVEALTLLGYSHHSAGRHAEAEAYLKRALSIKPDYSRAHNARLVYALPEWGGSVEAVQAAFDQAKQAGVTATQLAVFKDNYLERPWNSATPGAPRAYWEAAIRDLPTRQRLTALLNDHVSNENWLEALPVANRLLADYPDTMRGHYQRARVHQALGQIAEARHDYRMAAAQGHELAMQELVMAHITGGLGITGKDFAGSLPLCRYAATLGMGVGANCIGSLYVESAQIGLDFPVDAAQSNAWHLVGARAGHYNSQHDLGWMLFTGRVAGLEPEVSKKLGVYWLRRAAAQGHGFAQRKLEQNGIPAAEPVASGNVFETTLEWVKTLLRFWMGWML